ncbi:MAG: glycosyltransferase [Armatimonadetes bacterium]|nr:glycosyltransferase [Armatimonadota bacterium]NIM23089.1 glycosyltransferase [Armatimonadota bacterium]NIM66957.1 glycosyltransferase [Armatimonadota bacterium]NIM75491.1 glycosyltransferase [Armatimonadota bacterium]NIN05148.1 glycosyltransferase [Armatimonadota bacterium]
MASLSVIIPAYNAEDTIAQTVRAAAGIPKVSQIIVVDDGSSDYTATEAERAGADVLRLKRNRGKGAALRRGLEEASGGLVLLLDADLGKSAAPTSQLVEPVLNGDVQMTIAHFQPESEDKSGAPRRAGGFGFALGLARWGIRALTGLRMKSPLSGQRCLPRALLERVGIADGFGVEVALTLEVFRRGGRIQEIPLSLTHTATGRTLSGFAHRGRQFIDILRVLLGAAYGLGWPALGRLRSALRTFIWLFAITGLLAASYFSYARVTGPAAISLVLSFVSLPVILAVLVHANFLRRNYLELLIPTSVGVLFFFIWWGTSFWLHMGLPQTVGALLMVTWGILGLLDDRAFSRKTRGFRGHIKALLKGKFTSGAAKLFVGGGISLFAGWLISSGNLPIAILNGLLIALCTNFLNLLDLQPGRALKGFFVLGILAWILNPEMGTLLAPIFAAAIIYAPLDLGARAMMGDLGSNILGAMAGLALALSLGMEGKIILALILAAIHLYAEIGSISTLIEKIPPLRWLDRLGRAEG